MAILDTSVLIATNVQPLKGSLQSASRSLAELHFA
jgi:hypothetical protein